MSNFGELLRYYSKQKIERSRTTVAILIVSDKNYYTEFILRGVIPMGLKIKQYRKLYRI